MPRGSAVRTVTLDREAEEKSGEFGSKILALKPDIVIDKICFKLASARHLAEALRGNVQHFLHTGTIWVHGPSVAVPTTEMQPRKPFGEYGTQKAAIEAYLIDEARRHGFPATIVHPGHIVGPGWNPLNPAGHFNPEVFTTLAQRRGAGASEFRAGDGASRACRRRRADVHAGDRELERVGRRGLSQPCRRRR